MLDAPAGLADLVGHQRPRICEVPPRVSSSGQEAVELAESAGLVLDDWQGFALDAGLGERADGNWSAYEIGLIVARQNGKGAIFLARVLAGLFLLDEDLIMYSAHEFKTAAEMFRRIEGLISGCASMRKRVLRVTRSHGEEGIELVTGQRLRFVARSTGSGRGFSGQCNIWDEAQHLSDASVDALMPTMSAQANPQLWYGGSAPDKDLAPCGQIARVRRRGLAGDDPSLAYLEWSIDPHTAECGDGCDQHDNREDPESWAKANPGLGIRISVEHVAREFKSMSAKGFDRERLSVGNWPSEEADQWQVIPEAAWRAVADADSEALGRIAFALHVSPDRNWAAISAVGVRADRLWHAEVIEHRPGTTWTIPRMKQLARRWDPVATVVDAGGPAGSLIAGLEADDDDDGPGLEITKPTARQVGHAFGMFVDAVMPAEGPSTIRIMPHPVLDSAVAGAETRSLGDAKTWEAKVGEITTLVSMTNALWGMATYLEEEKPPPPATASAAKQDETNIYRPGERLGI